MVKCDDNYQRAVTNTLSTACCGEASRGGDPEPSRGPVQVLRGREIKHISDTSRVEFMDSFKVKQRVTFLLLDQAGRNILLH